MRQIIQGIAPAFVADLADRSGRRPLYIFCYVVFSAANIGLALQDSYVALLVLRMLQASGSSGTVALANGVVGDTITSSERGTYIAFASIGGILGPMISPILGGVIGQYAGWHFIFWFLLIFSSAVFIPLILFLPETCRNVVEDGSIPPPFLSTNITDTYRHKKRAKAGIIVDEEKRRRLHEKNKFRLPNPFSAVKVLLDLESALLLIATGLGLGSFYAIRYLPFFANGKHHTNLPFSLVLEHQMLSPNYSDLTRFR
jgi:multidrug resistance protein